MSARKCPIGERHKIDGSDYFGVMNTARGCIIWRSGEHEYSLVYVPGEFAYSVDGKVTLRGGK